MTQNNEIIGFLEIPLPGDQELMAYWRKKCLELGKEAIPVFIETLRSGPSYKHYGALVGLRVHGCDSTMKGMRGEEIFEVTVNGKTEVIDPKSKSVPNEDFFKEEVIKSKRFLTEVVFPPDANERADKFFKNYREGCNK